MAGADQQPNRYNAFGGVARAEARVMGFIKRDVEKQKKQMQTSEHVFGTVKYWDQASYYLCRGKEKVGRRRADVSELQHPPRDQSGGGVKNLMQRFQGTSMPVSREIG